ncbi:MAG: hypothetical protein QGH45_03115 [Myxococcota bacterium]|jgi:hypothetical protein|nr:hypothetical protein [Myxococcota bacterium]
MTWTARALLIAMTLGIAAPAVANDTLDGTFVLDLEASDDPAAIMKILGMNAVMRAIARKMKSKLTIDGDGTQVTIGVETSLGSNESVLQTDGTPITAKGGEFGSGSMSIRWSEDRTALIATSDTVMGDGRKVHNVTTRSLQDADTLLQQFDVLIEGEEPMTVKRIFRRVTDG